LTSIIIDLVAHSTSSEHFFRPRTPRIDRRPIRRRDARIRIARAALVFSQLESDSRIE
jgi:hypothetical protein